MEIVRETIASPARVLKDKAMANSNFPRRRRVRQRVGISKYNRSGGSYCDDLLAAMLTSLSTNQNINGCEANCRRRTMRVSYRSCQASRRGLYWMT